MFNIGGSKLLRPLVLIILFYDKSSLMPLGTFGRNVAGGVSSIKHYLQII